MSTNDPIEERRAANLRRAAAIIDKPGAIGRLAARLDAWRAEQREIRERVAQAIAKHPAGRGACDPEEGCCDGCDAAYSEPWAEPDGDDGADAPTLGNSRADLAAETNAIERRGVAEREATGRVSAATLDAYARNQAAWRALEDGERAARLAEDDGAAESGEEIV